jgi:hypothetical protein
MKHQKKDNRETDITDVEEEDTSSDGGGVITHPFKPDEIDIYTPPFTVSYLMDRIEHNEINMNADFQRSGDLWTQEKQCRLIESILLGLPLPAFYFDTSSSAWDIIDGLQRCCSIKNFCVDKTMKLKGLEYLTDMNGLGFDDLNRSLQRSIIMRPITVNLLKKSPPEVRYILFKRLNTAGLVLTPQEIRNAIYQGKAANVIKELSVLPEFLNATERKISIKRMQDRDFICRFVSFYLKGYKNYDTPDLDTFLNSGMDLLEKSDTQEITQNFKKALQLAMDMFGTDAFRRRTDKDAPRKPINKAYFEVITVSFAKINEEEERLLRQNSDLFKSNLIELMKCEQYSDSLSGGTGAKDRVHIRFLWFYQVMQKSIQGQKIRIGNDNKIEDC